MAWLLLVIAGLLEIGWATAMKESEGFTRLVPSVIAIVGALVSFVLLSIAMRDIPAGTGYAVWVGIGAVGVAVAGFTFFGEQVSVGRIAFLAVIVVGIVGLRLVEG